MSEANRLLDPQRLAQLRKTKILDSLPEKSFDRFTRLVTTIIGAPVALVSFVDDKRQFFKSSCGLAPPWSEARGTPLSHSFCQHVVAHDAPFVVVDAREDPRVADNGAVTEIGVAAYLGVPIRLDGAVLGSFCVIDTKPREWTEQEVSIVTDLAAAVEGEIALRAEVERAEQATRAVHREQSEKATLLDAIGEGVYRVDTLGICKFVNRAAVRMLGYEAEDLIGRDMHGAIHHTRPNGTPYPKAECPMLRAVADGECIQLEHEVLWRKDGSCFTAEYSSYPVVEAGAIVGSVLTFTDTTVRQDAHKRLLVQHGVSRALAEAGDQTSAIAQALAAIGTGLGWDCGVFWSRHEASHSLSCAATWSSPTLTAASFLKATGSLRFGRGEGLPGRVWADCAPVVIDAVAQDSSFVRRAEAAEAGLNTAFAFPVTAGTKVLGTVEFFLRGSLRADSALLLSVAALGELIGQYLRRHDAEDALRENEVLTRAIVDSSLDSVIAISDDSLIIEWNPAAEETFGHSREAAMGKDLADLIIPPEFRDAHRRGMEHYIATGSGPVLGRRIELEALRSNGERFPIELAITAVQAEQRVRFVAYIRDITTRRQVEEALSNAKEAAEQATAAKSQFIANMSHELRTPLSAVIGYAEVLEEEAEDLGAPAQSFLRDLRRIGTNAKHLLSLINNVLDLSKIEAGRMEVQLEDVLAETLVQQVVETVQPLFANNRTKLDVRTFPEVGLLHSDELKIRQCLINLLSNAAKFTKLGQVSLTVRRLQHPDRPAEIEFEVRDTGIGMDPEQLERLFQRFSQADSSTTRQFGGTGLGLAITRAFCHVLGGDIEVYSDPGQGSCFTMRILADLREAATAQHAPGAEPVAPANDGQSQAEGLHDAKHGLILVVDDDAATRDLLSRFLRRQGFRVSCAEDGVSGLRMARELRPAAILLDVMMPKMDGWSVLSAIKDDAVLAATPVIMVSILREQNLGFSLGATDYLTKPVDWPRLKKIVDRYRSDSAPGRALIIGDSPDSRHQLKHLLKIEGWRIEEAEYGAAAMRLIEAATQPLDLLLATTQDGGEDAVAFIYEFQKRQEFKGVPIIVVADEEMMAANVGQLQARVRRMLSPNADLPGELIAELNRITGLRGSRDEHPPGIGSH